MTRLALLPLLALSACATTSGAGWCTGAEVRRGIYTSAITVADAAIARHFVRGTPADTAVATREANVALLAALDAACPASTSATVR